MKVRACALMLAMVWIGMLQQVNAGVLLGSTRLVFEEGAGARALMLSNTNSYPVVVQAWVDEGQGDPENARAPYVVLPPVFHIQPGAAQGIRIVHDHSAMPSDRESMHWLNLYEVPPVATGADETQARLDVVLNTQIKVFYRPAALAKGPIDLVAGLIWSLHRQGGVLELVCDNQTPFHASITEIALMSGAEVVAEAEIAADMTAPPFSVRRYRMAAAADPVVLPKLERLRFGRVDDAGYVHMLYASLTAEGVAPDGR